MATKTTFSFLLLLFLVFVPSGGRSAADELKRACSVTRYRSLCVRSLSPFSHAAGSHGPRLWARAAVSVALAESDGASDYVSSLRRLPGTVGRVIDVCAECLGDAVTELHSALSELRRLRTGSSTFAWQMSNVETWASAALTNQDTCLNGLAGVGKRLAPAAAAPLRGLKAKVLNATYQCSNALALIHSLASSGGRT